MKLHSLFFSFLFLFFLTLPLLAESSDFSRSCINPFIMSQGVLLESSIVAFIMENNPHLEKNYVQKIVVAYLKESQKEGVNHDIAISQMLLETGYLKYKGQVSMHQNNFGGIGALDDGEVGASFASIEEGVRAHIQHLKAYGCTKKLCQDLVDPRFYLVKRGSARTFRELTGRWATDKNYHKKIALILKRAFLYGGEEETLALSFE